MYNRNYFCGMRAGIFQSGAFCKEHRDACFLLCIVLLRMLLRSSHSGRTCNKRQAVGTSANQRIVVTILSDIFQENVILKSQCAKFYSLSII